MSSSGEDEAGDVRSNLVFRGGRTNLHYRYGSFPCSAAGETTEVIAIAELGGRFIVAFPGSVWHRKVAKRKLSKAALGKVLC